MAQMSVEETIRMLRTPNPEEVAQQLEQEMQYYNNVKGLEGPFIESIRSGFERINQIYKEAGLESPFVLNYSDLQDALNKERENLRDLEELRKDLWNKYQQVTIDAEKYKGTTYSEVKEKRAEYNKQFKECNVQIGELSKKVKEMESYISTLTEESFNQQTNTYEYLYRCYYEATSERVKDSVSKKVIKDEVTTNQIQMELFGINKNLESLKSKQEVLKDKEAKIKELAASIGVELADFSFEAIAKEEVKEIEKAEEVHEEKPEHLEPIEEEKVDIKTVNELIEELKKLNPDAEITATMDGKINSKVRLSALALPEGFHYDEKLGITNKGEGVDYIAAEPGNVPEEEKVEEKAPDVVEEKVEKVEEAPVEGPVEKAPAAQNNSDSDSKEKEEDKANVETDNKEKTDAKESKIPLGERFKVTAARSAIVSPFIKSALVGYAITGMFAASWMLPSVIIGAGIGVGVQALYKIGWMAKFANDDMPVFNTYITQNEKPADQYTALVGGVHWGVNKLHEGIKSLHSGIKNLIDDYKEFKKWRANNKSEGLQEIYEAGVKKGIEEAAPVKTPEQQVSVTPEQPVVNEIPVQPENLDDAGDSSTSPVTPVEEVIEPVVSQVTPAEVNEKEAKIGNMIEALRNGTATEEEKDQIRVAVDGGLITDSALVEEVNGLLTGRGL